MADEAPGSPSTRKSDTERLHELGYAQELGRKMQGFSNMAVSFSIISILAGCLTTFYLALYAGGGPAIAYGWPIVTFAALTVAMSMGEVCSSYPTAGGLYYWSAKLAKRNAPFWSWTTGWFNLIGQVAITASIDFALANFVGAFLSLTTNFEPTNKSKNTDISHMRKLSPRTVTRVRSTDQRRSVSTRRLPSNVICRK